MKIEGQTTQNIESKDNASQMKFEDTDLLSSADIPFSDILIQKLNNCGINSISQTDNLTSLDFDYGYDSLSMELEDALFFVNLAQDGQFSVENTQNGDFKSLIQIETAQTVVSKKTVEITNKLTDLIDKAQNTQKPVRISFDNDISVILKVDKAGKVSAEFIPGTNEAENYLRNNISSLRQKFNEQNLPYNDLLYRQNEKRNKEHNNKNNKGE